MARGTKMNGSITDCTLYNLVSQKIGLGYVCNICQNIDSSKPYFNEISKVCVATCPDFTFTHAVNKICTFCKAGGKYFLSGKCYSQSCSQMGAVLVNSLINECKCQGLYLFPEGLVSLSSVATPPFKTCISSCLVLGLHYKTNDGYGNNVCAKCATLSPTHPYFDFSSQNCVEKCPHYTITNDTKKVCLTCKAIGKIFLGGKSHSITECSALNAIIAPTGKGWADANECTCGGENDSYFPQGVIQSYPLDMPKNKSCINSCSKYFLAQQILNGYKKCIRCVDLSPKTPFFNKSLNSCSSKVNCSSNSIKDTINQLCYKCSEIHPKMPILNQKGSFCISNISECPKDTIKDEAHQLCENCQNNYMHFFRGECREVSSCGELFAIQGLNYSLTNECICLPAMFYLGEYPTTRKNKICVSDCGEFGLTSSKDSYGNKCVSCPESDVNTPFFDLKSKACVSQQVVFPDPLGINTLAANIDKSKILTSCSPNPCKNEGVCISSKSDTTIFCTCQKGWLGKRCEINQKDAAKIVNKVKDNINKNWKIDRTINDEEMNEISVLSEITKSDKNFKDHSKVFSALSHLIDNQNAILRKNPNAVPSPKFANVINFSFELLV